MEISCDIIRDVLPLYAEDLVSNDTRNMVDEHLCACESCTEELAGLKKATALPMETEVESLQKVKKTIRRRWILSVLMAFSLAITLILSGALLLNARIYLPSDQAVERVEAREDGSIRIFWKDTVTGMGSSGEREELDGNYGVIAFTSLNKLLRHQDHPEYNELPQSMKDVIDEKDYTSSGYQLPGGAVNYNFWYIGNITGGYESPLWNAEKEYDQSVPLVDISYFTAFYVVILAIVGIFAFIIGFVAMPKRLKAWQKELCFRLAAVTLSLSLSTTIVTAGRFVSFFDDYETEIASGAILAVPMLLTILFARQLYLLNRKEKGL